MNSSGIKRGLATSAISALAIAGIPFIASPASASATDLTIAYQGPARSAGTEGAVVILSVPQGTVINDGDVKLFRSDLTGVAGDQNNSNQTVSIRDRGAGGAAGDVTPVADAQHVGDPATTDEYEVRILATTAAGVNTANFAVALSADNDVDPADLRTQVTLAIGRAPASLTVTPAAQTAGQGVDSAPYTVAIKDSQGNATQLTGNENLDIASTPGGVTISNPQIDANEAPRGTFNFTGRSATTGLYTINIAGDTDTDGIGVDVADGPAGVSASAQLDVIGAAAGVTTAQIDLVTGKDDWNGFGGKAFGSVTAVRSDQRSITLNFNSPANKNTVVKVTADGSSGTGVTFDGGTANTKDYTVTLDGNGVGSITITPDAASIANGDDITFSSPSFQGGGTFDVEFQNRAITIVENADTYISAFGGTVSPSVKVQDQFGDAFTNVFVTVQRTGGVNADATESARKAVDANGVVSFDLTDTKATATSRASDTLTFTVYPGELGAALATNNNDAKPTIVYTADGKGADFFITVDTVSPTGAAYDPNAVSAVPLTDTNANLAGELIDLGIVGGNTGAPVTVTVDNGALVLKGSETRLAQGSASDSGKVGDNFDIIGTEAGIVNVTVTSGGITKTGQVSIRTFGQATPFDATADTASEATARNVDVTGPSAATAGQLVEFVVSVTDAFGNPVRGVDPEDLNILLTGPATVKGNSGSSNADGQITYTVELDQDADNAVTFRATGLPTVGQFGAAADRLDDQDTTNTGPGLTASDNVGEASIAEVVDIADLEQAVAEAEARLAAAQADLADAQGDLDVAQAQLAVAQAEVDRLRERKADLRKKLNKAKRNDNKQKAKTTRKKLRAVKRQLADARDAVVVAQTRVDAEQNVVNLRQDQVDAAQAELDEAEQNLEDAQN